MSSEEKTDYSYTQTTPTRGSRNTVKRELYAQENYPESQNTAVERSTKEVSRITNNSHSVKSAVDERFDGRSPKFRELLKNFEEQSSPVCNGSQKRLSQKNATWNSYELCARKESGNIAPYRDIALRNEDYNYKAIRTKEDHELRNREPLHKGNLTDDSNNIELFKRSFKTLSQTKTWLESPQDKRMEPRPQETQKNINYSQDPMLARVSRESIHNDQQKHCSSTNRWPQNSTEHHLSSSATMSERRAAESHYLTYSNSLETSAFQSKLCSSDQSSNRKSRQNIKTDFTVANFDQSISSAAQVALRRSSVQQLTSQKVAQSDRSTWAIRPHVTDINGSHIRARSHSPKAFLDRNGFFVKSNADFATQVQPLREATDRNSKSYRFTETQNSK